MNWDAKNTFFVFLRDTAHFHVNKTSSQADEAQPAWK